MTPPYLPTNRRGENLILNLMQITYILPGTLVYTGKGEANSRTNSFSEKKELGRHINQLIVKN